MGPKKGKENASDDYWRTAIQNAVLNEARWSAKVVLMEAAGGDQDRLYLSKFEQYSAEEKRFVIKNICKTETIFMVNQLGVEKKVKDDNLRVFEEGQSYLKDKKEIPVDLVALIIKHLILKMKEEYLYIKRQRLEVQQGILRESMTMTNRAEVRSNVPEEPPATPVSAAKGKGKKADHEADPEPDQNKKYNTMLRVRGEEWRDKVYVDDYPSDGPDLYIAVTGFVDPLLAENLIKIGVPLTAIVQIRIDPTTSKVPSSLFRSTKRGQSQTELLSDHSLKFWETTQESRISYQTADYYKETAFVVFRPPYWDSDKLTGNPEQIYDDLCFLLYDLQDLTRQHANYINNMEVFPVPSEELNDNLVKKVQKSLEYLPLECVTMYSILDGILQVISRNLDENDNEKESSVSAVSTSTRPEPIPDDNLGKAEYFVKDIMNTLCKTDRNKKTYRLTSGDEYENHKKPIVINHGDIAKYTTFQLGNINLDNIVYCTLADMPINKLWQYQKLATGELEAKINFHVNVLLSCFERNDVETSELNRMIHILACRKIYNNKSSSKKVHIPACSLSEFKNIYLKRSVLAEPLPKCPSRIPSIHGASPQRAPSLTNQDSFVESTKVQSDDPEVDRIKMLFDCPDISELVSAAEIISGKSVSHMIDEFDFFEDFSGINSFQVLWEAFNSFNCVDYKYCEITDCFILMFYNSHDKDGIAREEWRYHVPTPVCLQDFFDFILDEHYDWIRKEEIKYDNEKMSKHKSICQEQEDRGDFITCVETTDVAQDLLMEGSLKHQDICKLEEITVDTVTDVKSISKKTTTMSPVSTPDAKSTPKSKSPMTTKSARKSYVEIEPEKKIVKPFLGYALGDRRVEVFGKDSTYFSKDGTCVKTAYTLLIPDNAEYIHLCVKPGNHVNEFWMHKAVGDEVSTEILDTCESFMINTKDRAIINIKKRTYVEIPPPSSPLETSAVNVKKNESSLKSPDKSIILEKPLHYHSLYITWPNGLITESIHNENSSTISHIKQHYIANMSHLDEEMRCISLNGEVVIFKPSGDIEVLLPSGAWMKITKYEKRPVVQVTEEIESFVSSDKSKKGKGKEKDKDKDKGKGGKKNIDIPEEEPKEEMVNYELIIEEFEFIETNGLRQQYINDIGYDIEKLLIRTATDYCLGEVFSKRMDGTYCLLNKDGVHVVTFPNKTRIITKIIVEDEEILPEWTEEEKQYFEMLSYDNTHTSRSKASASQKSYEGDCSPSLASSISSLVGEEETSSPQESEGYVSVLLSYTIEHPNFATVTINKLNDKITIDSPNNTSVTVDQFNHYEMKLDVDTIARFDGTNLFIDYEECSECRSYTTCSVKIRSEETTSSEKVPQAWLKMKDSFMKEISIDDEGNISLGEPIHSDDASTQQKTERLDVEESATVLDEKDNASKTSSIISHGRCRVMYQAREKRFFVLRRDMSCSELLHRALVEEQQMKCRWQPWCSINNHDTFGDNRSLLTLLTPINMTESEKWLMDSMLADKPKYLTYKDLKKDNGKGFYHWMRPYKRFEPQPQKPDNELPVGLPKAYILRILEQQWSDANREKLKGASELCQAILLYRKVMDEDCEKILHVPILDPRPENERNTDEIIQALAHRLYTELKDKLEEDVQSRARYDITTKPQPPEEMTIEEEYEEEYIDEYTKVTKGRISQVEEVEAADKMSPRLQQYWHRRAEERKEQDFYLYLLRQGSVPPYFKNVLGGAIWWDMNHVATQAVDNTERRRMKCVCADEETTQPATTSDK